MTSVYLFLASCDIGDAVAIFVPRDAEGGVLIGPVDLTGQAHCRGHRHIHPTRHVVICPPNVHHLVQLCNMSFMLNHCNE